MRAIKFAMLTFLLATAPGSSGSAYEIGSGSVAKKSFDVHETLTRLAVGCLQRSRETPTNCVDLHSLLVPLVRQAATTRPDELVHAARWPDDPNRRLDANASKVTFGVLLKERCREVIAKKPDLNTAGLECSSHFGRLQFLHSQANSDDRRSLGDAELARATRAKILAWARFSFLAATDDTFLAQGFCAIDPRYGIDGGMMHAFRMSTTNFCAGTRRVPGWTVRTLFGLRCKSPNPFAGCAFLDAGEAQRAASGALVHLIQDSYSQSHVVRLAAGQAPPPPTGPFEAKVVCAPITKFFEYGEQNVAGIDGDPHGKADRPPALDNSCLRADRPVDDVITASAIALWHVDRARRGERCDARLTCDAALDRYLATRVFPLA